MQTHGSGACIALPVRRPHGGQNRFHLSGSTHHDSTCRPSIHAYGAGQAPTREPSEAAANTDAPAHPPKQRRCLGCMYACVACMHACMRPAHPAYGPRAWPPHRASRRLICERYLEGLLTPMWLWLARPPPCASMAHCTPCPAICAGAALPRSACMCRLGEWVRPVRGCLTQSSGWCSSTTEGRPARSWGLHSVHVAQRTDHQRQSCCLLAARTCHWQKPLALHSTQRLSTRGAQSTAFFVPGFVWWPFVRARRVLTRAR